MEKIEYNFNMTYLTNKIDEPKRAVIAGYCFLLTALVLMIGIWHQLATFTVSAQNSCAKPEEAPQLPVVSSDLTGKVKVRWTDNSTNETGFRIYRYDRKQYKWLNVKEILSTTVTSKFTYYEAYDDTLVCDGNPTSYSIAAYNSCGEAGGGSTNGACLPSELIQTPAPTTRPCIYKQSGDADCDGKVNIVDFERWRREYLGELPTKTANFDYIMGSDTVDIVDFEIWRSYFFDPDTPH